MNAIGYHMYTTDKSTQVGQCLLQQDQQFYNDFNSSLIATLAMHYKTATYHILLRRNNQLRIKS